MKFVVGRRDLELDAPDVITAMRNRIPETVRTFVVEVGGEWFPPKQVFATVTSWNRGTFTTYEAVRILRRLGFHVVDDREVKERRGTTPATPRAIDDRLGHVESGLKVLQTAIAGIADRLSIIEGASVRK